MGTEININKGGDGFFPKPYIDSTLIRGLNSATKTYTIKGAYFTENTTITINGSTVNSVNFISDNEIKIEVTASTTDGLYDIIITNESGSTIITDGFEIFTSSWIDLRLNGNTFTDGNASGNDIRYKTGMSMVRDADGMYFTGIAPWQSWVKFETLGWTRGQNKKLEWILTPPTNYMMIGIGSDAIDEASTSQYQQGETLAYFNNSTSFWGLYGNNGIVGTAGNQAITTSIPSTTPIKIVFEGDGGVGGTFTMYQLLSTNQVDWDDESNVLATTTIGGTLNPDEVNLMPFIVPLNGGTQRFIALKIT